MWPLTRKLNEFGKVVRNKAPGWYLGIIRSTCFIISKRTCLSLKMSLWRWCYLWWSIGISTFFSLMLRRLSCMAISTLWSMCLKYLDLKTPIRKTGMGLEVVQVTVRYQTSPKDVEGASGWDFKKTWAHAINSRQCPVSQQQLFNIASYACQQRSYCWKIKDW
jgi:hypothetical protein